MLGQVQAAMMDLLQSHPQRLVVDLSGITFMDSSGLALLVLACRNAGSIEIRQSSAIARRVIEATGLAGYLGLEPHDS